MKKFLLFVIACTLGLFGTVSAQETITIGDGSAGENYAPPIDFYYSNAISQQIFSASSLEIPSGSVISKIAFKRSGGSAPKRNWSIYMQNSEAGVFVYPEYTVSLKPVESSDKVYSGTFTIPSEENVWVPFELTETFTYEGGDLILTVIDNTGSSGGDQWWVNSFGFGSSVHDGKNTAYNEGANYSFYLSYTYTSDIQLTYTAGEGGEDVEEPETPEVPTINGHEYVDLGLPSGLLWATCNIGATSPEEYGDYFAWGETETKAEYTDDNCATKNVSMNDISGNAQYDAATANWGGDWRMPTENELNELINNCTWTWITQNGVNGYNVEGPNGNSIFLPVAGHRYGSSLIGAGSKGYYLSSTPGENYDAYRIYFNSSKYEMGTYFRTKGLSVRPVSGGGFEGPAAQYASVETAEVTEIKATSAVCGGNVTTDGGVEVTARGVCWSTSQNPTIEDNKTTDGNGVGSFTSQIPNLVPNTQYYVRAYATNEVGTSYGEEVSFTTLEGTYANGHEYVDLGLPSGLLWATCNVGAETPEAYGNYYAWGETTTKTDYSSSTSATYGLSKSQLQSQGYIDSEGNLTSQYDAATANWGGDWRMPTYAELNELNTKCTWTWTTQNGVNGYNVEGPNGNSIFLPAAGHRNWSSLYYAGGSGYYWSSTPNEYFDGSAYFLGVYSDSLNMYDYGSRYDGLSVRPVSGGGFEGPAAQYASVETAEVTEIKATSAVCGGNVTTDGGVEVTARGVCWSTSQNPTIEDNKTTDGNGVGNFTSQIPNLVPNTQYYVRAYATNEVGTSYGEEVSFTTLERTFENGYEYVDLGLSVKWATCNVGATSPEEYGDYFAWGETSTKEKYYEDNCPTYGHSISQLQSQGYIDSEGNLTSQYDAAAANWGGDWRMPTYDELKELKDNCIWTWTTQNGVNGYNVEGPNGNSIFLPAAGYRFGPSLDSSVESYGGYWSSTPGEGNDCYAYGLDFNRVLQGMYYGSRSDGISVRPVSGGGFEGPAAQYASVETAEVTEIKATSAVCGGNVTTDGGVEVTARGVCWSTSQNPTIEDNKTTDGNGVGSFTSQIPNLVPNTQYYVRAYATNEAGTSYGDELSFTTLEINANGHTYVDLGLPSGLLWATCNVGAITPEEYGDYFAWGETETKETYTEDNCATYNVSMNDISGNAQYDAATANWGGDWRMPTKNELNELRTKCTWTWTTQNGVNGYNVEGPNGNSIFLPAAGLRYGSSLYYAGYYGYYWSSAPFDDDYGAYCLDFDSDFRHMNDDYRRNGRSVRPVSGGGFEGPAAPANLVAEAISETSIALTWESIGYASNYNVYQGENVVATDVTETTFVVEGLDPFADYCFTVTAANEFGESAKSVEACAKTLDLVIAAPANLVAKAETSSSIVLTWNAVENALSYNVYNDTVLVANVTSTTYTVEGLASYTDYSFTVSAVRNEQEMVSEAVSAKTLDLTIVAPVVTAEATSISTIVLTWEAVENAFSYVVYQGEDLIANVTDTTFTVEGLTAETDYSFTVSSLRNEQEVMSETVSAKTLAEEPVVPEPVVPEAPVVEAEATSDTTIVLTWNAVEGATSYNVYNDTVLVENVTDTVYVVTGLETATEYCFTVTAVNEAGESEKSDEVCKTLGEGVEDLASAFNIYPNPVNDKLYIETDVEIEEVVVYDVFGRQQSTDNGQQSFIDVAGLNSGVYFVKIVTENGEVVKRFIKK